MQSNEIFYLEEAVTYVVLCSVSYWLIQTAFTAQAILHIISHSPYVTNGSIRIPVSDYIRRVRDLRR